jgi:hypothetical protein
MARPQLGRSALALQVHGVSLASETIALLLGDYGLQVIVSRKHRASVYVVLSPNAKQTYGYVHMGMVQCEYKMQRNKRLKFSGWFA